MVITTKSKNIFEATCSSSNIIPISIHYDTIYAFKNIDKANLFNTFCHSVFTASNFLPLAMGDIPVPDLNLSSVGFFYADVHDILVCVGISKKMDFKTLYFSSL